MRALKPTDLKPYQRSMINDMVSKPRCFMIASMGLGKTVCGWSAIKLYLREIEAGAKILLVAPNQRSLVETWLDELNNWSHLSVLKDYIHVIYHKPQRDKERESTKPITLITIHQLPHLLAEGRYPDYQYIVVDESSILKSYNTNRFKEIKLFLREREERVKNIVLLTATPASNSYEALWAQVYILDGGYSLGACISHFRQQYGYQKAYDRYTWYYTDQSKKLIRQQIKHLTCVYDAKDHIKMPLKSIFEIRFELGSHFKRYKEFEETFYDELSGVYSKNRRLCGNKLRQFTSGFLYKKEDIYRIHEKKINALKELREATDDNLLVVVEFIEEKEEIKRHFKEAVVLTDDMTKNKAAWDKKEISMLIINSKSCSHSLNLQYGGCSTLIFYSLPWSAEAFTQVQGRIWRTGQEKDVKVYALIAAKTIDEIILKLLKRRNNSEINLKEELKRELKKRYTKQGSQ